MQLVVKTRGELLGQHLVVCKERSALGVTGRLSSSPEVLATRPCRNSDDKGEDEQDCHDGEGEDPLERDDLSLELSYTQSGRQHAQEESHGIILVDDDEECSIDQNGPDENVGKDPSYKSVGMGHHDGAVPVDGDKGPGKRSRHSRCVDESGVGIVAEVQRGKVEEVDDEDDLGPGEVRSHEQHDEGEVQEIIEDEVAAHCTSGIHIVDIAGEEMADVANLEDADDGPVDLGDSVVESEAGVDELVLVPDSAANSEAIVGLLDAVVNRDNDRQQPGENGQDLVCDDGIGIVGLLLGEGVDAVKAVHDDDAWNVSERGPGWK